LSARFGQLVQWRTMLMVAVVVMAAGFALVGGEVAAQTKAKISEEQAKKIASKYLPGEITGVKIERKKGKEVYAVEIQSKDRGELDVLVDIMTGKVVGTD
jgi:uncharacterized membrane protein YkoI